MKFPIDDTLVALFVILSSLAAVGLFVFAFSAKKEPETQQNPTFQLHKSQASYIYLSLETPSGKGWAKTGMEALDKLVSLQIQPPMAVPVPRKDIANLRRIILNNVEKTGFIKSDVVYIAGQDREATKRYIQRLMPRAAIKLV